VLHVQNQQVCINMGSITLDFKSLAHLKRDYTWLHWHCKAPSIGLSPIACKCQFTQYATQCGSTAARAFILFITTWGSEQNLSKLLTHINNLQCVPQFIKRKLYNLCNVLLETSLIKKTPDEYNSSTG
jgi:hypothetical protein